jgi:hypothetical protein
MTTDIAEVERRLGQGQQIALHQRQAVNAVP